MTTEELMRVKLLLAEARADMLAKRTGQLDEAFELVCEIAQHWRAFAPDDAEYPAEIKRKLEAFAA